MCCQTLEWASGYLIRSRILSLSFTETFHLNVFFSSCYRMCWYFWREFFLHRQKNEFYGKWWKVLGNYDGMNIELSRKQTYQTYRRIYFIQIFIPFSLFWTISSVTVLCYDYDSSELRLVYNNNHTINSYWANWKNIYYRKQNESIQFASKSSHCFIRRLFKGHKSIDYAGELYLQFGKRQKYMHDSWHKNCLGWKWNYCR